MSRWEGFEELVRVVEIGSFSGAARAMGVSKGHVSQRIGQLEDRLGVRLLHRTTRKLSLTELGNLYYQRCKQVIEDLDEIEHAVSKYQQRATGLLKISSPNLLGELHIVPAIAEFLTANPSLEIELNFYSRKVDLVEDAYDVAIQVGARTDINVINKPLAKTTFQLVATPRFLNRHGAPEKPSDLKQLRCVMFTEYGVSKPWKFVRGDEEVSVTGLCRWHSNNGHCLLAAARDSLGLAYLPDYYVAEDLANGRLVRVLEEWGGIERDVVAIYQQRRHLSAKVKLFVDFLQNRFHQRKPW
jgi:DNA-binding transcriptional LysR family regulator